MRYTSSTIEKTVGCTTKKVWFNVNMENETEICDFANALITVLSKVFDYDEDELEEEWMQMSFDERTCTPNLTGAEEFFDKYAEEVLEDMWALEPEAFEIFNFVETEEEEHREYGSGDDGFAAAMFPVKEGKLKESGSQYLVIVKPSKKADWKEARNAVHEYNEMNPECKLQYNEYQDQWSSFNMNMAQCQDVLEYFLPLGRNLFDKVEFYPNI
mgnify:CR=1 FL=1